MNRYLRDEREAVGVSRSDLHRRLQTKLHRRVDRILCTRLQKRQPKVYQAERDLHPFEMSAGVGHKVHDHRICLHSVRARASANFQFRPSSTSSFPAHYTHPCRARQLHVASRCHLSPACPRFPVVGVLVDVCRRG